MNTLLTGVLVMPAWLITHGLNITHTVPAPMLALLGLVIGGGLAATGKELRKGSEER